MVFPTRSHASSALTASCWAYGVAHIHAHTHVHITSVWQPKSSKKHVIKQDRTVAALDRTGHVSRDHNGGVLGEVVQGGKRRCKQEMKEEGKKKFEELEERFKRREQGHPLQAIHLPVYTHTCLCAHPFTCLCAHPFTCLCAHTLYKQFTCLCARCCAYTPVYMRCFCVYCVSLCGCMSACLAMLL